MIKRFIFHRKKGYVHKISFRNRAGYISFTSKLELELFAYIPFVSFFWNLYNEKYFHFYT